MPMTTEKILEKCLNIAVWLPEEEAKNYKEAAERAEQGERMSSSGIVDIGVLLADLCADLRADIGEQTARKNGKGAAYAAAKRICKSAMQHANVTVHGYWMDEEGRQCLCDGFRGVRLANIYELPKLDPTFNPMNLDKCMPLDCTERVELPDLAELKTALKIWKAENPKPKGKRANSYNLPVCRYDFGEGKPEFDAQYLIDMMEALPGAEAYINPARGDKSSIYFKGDAGDGVLMPMRKLPAQQAS